MRARPIDPDGHLCAATGCGQFGPFGFAPVNERGRMLRPSTWACAAHRAEIGARTFAHTRPSAPTRALATTSQARLL